MKYFFYLNFLILFRKRNIISCALKSVNMKYFFLVFLTIMLYSCSNPLENVYNQDHVAKDLLALKEIISSDETINAIDAGKLRNKLNSKALFCKKLIFLKFF